MSSKKILLIALILGINTVFAQEQVIIGQKIVMHSAVLNEDRVYQMYLPASYAWAIDRTYPVLYILDGESNFFHTAATVDFLSSEGEIPELIVVAVNSTIRIRDFTQTDWSSHWVGGGGAGNFKRFLSEELIPKIEKEYRTNGFRILSGHSAAGQFTLYALSSQPSLFNAYFAISPSLNWDNKLPQRSLDESFGHTDSLKAFLYFAWSDDFGEALADDKMVVETLDNRSPKGLRWIAKGFPEETHGSITLPAQIDALRQLFSGYRLYNDLLDKGLEYAEKHFRDVSKKVGYVIPVPEDVINRFGYDALNNGNIPQAIDLFKRNIKQNPNSANAYDSITDAYEKLRMWSEATASSERAVELARKYNHPNLSYFIQHALKVKENSKAGPGK